MALKTKILRESDILDADLRKVVIEEIQGPENTQRKHEAYKRYLCHKDQTDKYVVDMLLKQFDTDTVREMSYCLSNVSFVRKVIDKLARVYNSGVKREIEGDEAGTTNLEMLAKKMKFNSELKKTNKYLKLQRNVALYVKPCPVYKGDETVPEWNIKLEPLAPYLYDVIENQYDRTKPMVFILSHYKPTTMAYSQANLADNAAREGRSFNTPQVKPQSDGKDQAIADSPVDSGADDENFIFWTESYHFTCNAKGEIIKGSDDADSIANPIGELPIEEFSIDQDGSFWAEGGNDLVNGGILINSMITNILHIGVTQGYGQFYMTGSNLPRNLKVGPNKTILMEYGKEDAVPSLGFANANPDLDSLRNLVEMYCALLLTTNNLSTSGVSTKLEGSMSAPSGVALMIDKAESLEDVQDQQQIFIDKEPCVWRKVQKWQAVYGEALIEGLRQYPLPEDIEDNLKVQFLEAQSIMSETEKLNNLSLRKTLGIDTMVDLIMKDNPQLSKEQAEQKLLELVAERTKYAILFMQAQTAAQSANPMNKKDTQLNETLPSSDNQEPAAPETDVTGESSQNN